MTTSILAIILSLVAIGGLLFHMLAFKYWSAYRETMSGIVKK